MRKIEKIILHCSDSSFGDASIIDEWHRERGFDCIGYHYVVLNGVRAAGAAYNKGDDGVLETGRAVDKDGAHCIGANRTSIGVCLIGRQSFTSAQLFDAVPKLFSSIFNEHKLTVNDVYGHYEYEPRKTCPNLDMSVYRRALKNILEARP